MKSIKLTDFEAESLLTLIAFGNVCRHGCVLEEMKNSKKDCDECKFNLALYSVADKINPDS